ncbi:hypothetical protein EW145_g1942 [Phellinidium pouzarii]|uniref:Uncharacterized protein n=1 Tax=Phellinidium pouzarii TaxID=167371 RepID=A0A4S4LCW7_9AGAM|nr:hypothetical protein EW145_g1942 [Phellinidium pouzarii]
MKVKFPPKASRMLCEPAGIKKDSHSSYSITKDCNSLQGSDGRIINLGERKAPWLKDGEIYEHVYEDIVAPKGKCLLAWKVSILALRVMEKWRPASGL